MVERMNIRAALDRLVAIQGGLSITDPTATSISTAYKYVPRQDTTLPGTPCWMNDWTLIREERHIDMRIQFYTVHMQLFVRDADQDQAADIASAFMEKTVGSARRRRDPGRRGNPAEPARGRADAGKSGAGRAVVHRARPVSGSGNEGSEELLVGEVKGGWPI